MAKKCFGCGEVQELDGFYPHPRMADGHLNKCKECIKADVAERLRKKVATPEGLESERARGREKYHRLYGMGPNWKSPVATTAQKKLAGSRLQHAIRNGRVLKGTRCEDCGRKHPRLHGHHEDYSAPLAVTWLCPICHRKRHAIYPDRVKGSR